MNKHKRVKQWFGSMAGLMMFTILVYGTESSTALIYQDDAESSNFASRYTKSHGSWSYVAAPGGGKALTPGSHNGADNWIESTTFQGGGFTETHIAASFRLYNNNRGGDGAYVDIVLLRNALTVGTSKNAGNRVAGYSFKVYALGSNAVLMINRINKDGTITALYANRPGKMKPGSPNESCPAFRADYWENITATVNVNPSSTNLSLTWSGRKPDGMTPVTYTTTFSDTSAGRFKSGTGFALRGYPGDRLKGVFIDNIQISKSTK